jgi:hypothetical protein
MKTNLHERAQKLAERYNRLYSNCKGFERMTKTDAYIRIEPKIDHESHLNAYFN